MKYAKHIGCVVALLVSLSGFALTETVNGVKWTYTVSNGEASLGIDSSSSPAVPTSTAGAIVIPSALGGYSVTMIGSYAFRNCTRLTSVTVPESVTRIQDSAFNGCCGLTALTVPFVGLQRGNRRKREALFGYVFGNSSYAGGIKMTSCCTESSSGSSFYIPSSLRSVVVTDETLLGYGAFSGLSGLTSIVIDDNVTGIETEVFRGCSGLTNVVIGTGVTSIGSSAFNGCSCLTNVTIPDSVTSIGGYAFYNCNSLTSMVIPQGVTSIEGYAFYNCSCLTNVTIPDSVTSIGDSTFSGCSGLTSVTMPDSVTSIGSGAFENCSGLTSVSLGKNVTNIGRCAFSGCTGIVAFNIPDTNSYYRFEAGFLLSKNGRSLIAMLVSLAKVTIPSSVTSIASYAFYGCNGLTDVTIPSGVTSIGDFAFYNCSNLTNVVIPNSVTSIGYNAFDTTPFYANQEDGLVILGRVAYKIKGACPSVVVIPDIVTSIGTYAFYGCSGLVSVSIPDSVTSIGYLAFYGCSGLVSVEISQYVCNQRLWSVFPSAYQTIESVVISDGVTSIGSSAFDGCSGIKNVTISQGACNYRLSSVFPSAYQSITNVVISANVTRINTSAFSGCTGIRSFIVEEGNAAYCAENGLLLSKDGSTLYRSLYGCVTIPHGVTNIGDYAFEWRDDLTSVTIPNSVTNIGNHAFYECSELTGVTIPDSVTSIGRYAFYNCTNLVGALTIPDGVTRIEDSTFYNCSGLTSVTMPNSVTNIGNYAFYECNGLISMTIPNDVKRIGSYAFYNCTNLVGMMTIPDGMTCIEDFTFYNCRGLTSVTIPNTVTSIGASVFRGCKGFTGIITIPPSVTNIGTTAFYGCSNLKGVNIEDVAAWCNITFGNAYANPLRYARNLYIDNSPATDLTIPDSVTNIGSNSFYNCTNLLSLTIPVGITRIGAYSFYGCGSVTNVTVSESVAAIDDYAFYNCNRLARMTFRGNAPTVGPSVFVSGSPCTAYVRTTSTGWGVTIPGRWNGIAIDYLHYTVTMDANGGICETASLDVMDGTSVDALPTPTWGNAVFLGWFTEAEGGEQVLIVTEPTTLHAHWLTEVARPVIVSDFGAVFRADSCVVSITSETEGATIYYTVDGTTPKRYDDYLYAGPITITDTTTFKAVAVVGGLRSAYTTVTITKHNLTLDEALNVGEGVALATNPALPWQPVYDAHAKLGDATAQSCAIGNRTNTWFTATVSGAGTMSFWLKTSCEHDDEDLFTCDRLMVYTNGVEITAWRMDGETDWTQRTVTFAGGENTVKWVYYKDKSDTGGEDCAWVDGIEWVPSAEAMLAAWLAERNLTADARAANGRTAAECYALGLDPTDATNDFRIVSIEIVDGEPKVVWEPKTNRWTGVEIQAVLKGSATLDGEWKAVEGATAEEKAAMRFFKVVVEVQ